MHRRQILAALSLLVFAEPARASEAPKKDSDGQYVDLAPIALPVVVKGRLVNYVFCSLRINLSPSADAAKVRAKEPWFRDAIIRVAHRTPFTVATDYTRIDEARLKAALVREAIAIAGARNIASVTLSSQTPKHRARVPRPPAAAR